MRRSLPGIFTKLKHKTTQDLITDPEHHLATQPTQDHSQTTINNSTQYRNSKTNTNTTFKMFDDF